MTIAVTFGVLLLAACFTLAGSIHAGLNHADIASQTGTVIGLGFAFVTFLGKANMRFYFFLQRCKLRFDPTSVTKLSLTVRFDGLFSDEVLSELVSFLTDHNKFVQPSRLQHISSRSALLYLTPGMTLALTQEPASLSFDAKSHIQICLNELELPTHYAATKLERQILPLISTIGTFLHFESEVLQVDLGFGKRNPYFSLYISHLKPDQVSDFTITLYIPKNEADKLDKIVIRKTTLTLTAGTVDGMAQLARDYILLSPHLTAERIESNV